MVDNLRANASLYLLLVGAALGLGASVWSALGVGQSLERYADAVAVVDGVPISKTVYETAIEGLASAKRNPLSDAEKREALDRIIDEELLLQRALTLGMGESDPSSRKALVNAMLQFTIADVSQREPTDAALATFYAERPKLIAPQPLLTLRAVSIPLKEGSRAAALKAALDSGVGFDVAVKQFSAEGLLLPNGPVIPAKIAEYAGATVRDTALSLQGGQSVGPIEIAGRFVFVHLISRTEAPPPPLEAVRDVVAEEWRKREAESAFERYVQGLRRSARISYADGVPQSGTSK